MAWETARLEKSQVLLVGQAPSRVMKPGDRPFEGTRALANLARLCGISRAEELYHIFDMVNLVDEYPGPSHPGSKWDATPVVSPKRRKELIEQFVNYRIVVLLGACVRNQFLNAGTPMFKWVHMFDTAMIWSPHPGGTSFAWNDPEVKKKGQTLWHAIAVDEVLRRQRVF